MNQVALLSDIPTCSSVLILPDLMLFLYNHNLSPNDLMDRHKSGDYGDVPESIRVENCRSIAAGFGNAISIYKVADRLVSVVTVVESGETLIVADPPV